MSGMKDSQGDTRSHLHQHRLRSKRDCGQVRLVLGTAVLIIVGPTLIAAAWKIQQTLASSQAFSWWTASLLALLVVAMVVAAIFADE
jgi:hypothetical protein